MKRWSTVPPLRRLASAPSSAAAFRSFRHFSASASAASASPPGSLGRLLRRLRGLLTKQVTLPLPLAIAGFYAANVTMQQHFGSAENFFEGKYITNKEADDVSEFYQAEDLLKIISIHPIFFNIFMDKVEPDTKAPSEDTALLSLGETHVTVKLLGMEVSFEIIEQESPDAEGHMKLSKFIRHERFVDWVPLLADWGIKILLWDQTWKYGFNRSEDGRLEVYHRCEKFHGPWPIRLIIFFHQRYVLWACDRYINGDAFGTDDIDRQQEQMAFLPMYKFQSFVTKLREQKQAHLENLRSAYHQDKELIAKAEASLERLVKLGSRQEASIALVQGIGTRKKSFKAKAPDVRLVSQDADTQEVLEMALADRETSRAVHDAMKELANVKDLDWKPKRSPSRINKAATSEAS